LKEQVLFSHGTQSERDANAKEREMSGKKTIQALERVFAAEIEGRLPYQSTAKIYAVLHEEGLVEPMERNFGVDRLGTMTVPGWQLTHAGRFLYCSSC
jgi:hypothetical protein